MGEHIAAYRAHANFGVIQSLFTTTDGVEKGGQRLAQEIQDLAEQNPSLRSYSLVCISLGGLYCRYAAGVLHNTSSFALEPINFVSIASPHLGVRDHLSEIYRWAARKGVAGQSGFDTMLMDKRHILQRLTNET